MFTPSEHHDLRSPLIQHDRACVRRLPSRNTRVGADVTFFEHAVLVRVFLLQSALRIRPEVVYVINFKVYNTV